MSHERLAELIRAQREAMAAQPEAWATHGTILGILTALEQGEVTEGRALYLLRNQATHLVDEPTHAALSRQAAAAIRQMRASGVLNDGRTRRGGATPPDGDAHAQPCPHWHQALPGLRAGDRMLHQAQDAFRGYQATLSGLLEHGAIIRSSSILARALGASVTDGAGLA